LRDFILLMHSDTMSSPTPEMWPDYLARLVARGVFNGGSAIGAGRTWRKQAVPAGLSGHLTGFIRVRAESLADAETLLAGNPVWECGGTVELRELPRD
jgi:hypothetical protein